MLIYINKMYEKERRFRIDLSDVAKTPQKMPTALNLMEGEKNSKNYDTNVL